LAGCPKMFGLRRPNVFGWKLAPLFMTLRRMECGCRICDRSLAPAIELPCPSPDGISAGMMYEFLGTVMGRRSVRPGTSEWIMPDWDGPTIGGGAFGAVTLPPRFAAAEMPRKAPIVMGSTIPDSGKPWLVWKLRMPSLVIS